MRWTILIVSSRRRYYYSLSEHRRLAKFRTVSEQFEYREKPSVRRIVEMRNGGMVAAFINPLSLTISRTDVECAYKRSVSPFPPLVLVSPICTNCQRTCCMYVRRYNLNAKNSFEYSDTRYYFYTRDTASASSRQRPREYTRLRKDTGSRLLLDGGVGGGFNFIGMAVIFHFSPSSSLPISSLSWITRHPP